MKTKTSPGKIILEVVSVIIAITFITPIIWALAVSLKYEGMQISNTFQWFAPPYTLNNYPDIIRGTSVPYWLFNSLFLAVLSVLMTLLLSSMAAFAIAKLKFKGSGAMYMYFLMGLMVPGEATIVPLFITVNGLNLIDSYGGMLFPGIAGSMNLIIMITFFKGIPDELIEAAHIDGAGNLNIFFNVILPLSKTVLVTVGIFSFLGSWNNYLWPLLCAMSEGMYTLPIGIPTLLSTYTTDYVIPMTANMVASLPAIILYLIFEKQIVQGVALSGIKG